MSRRTISLPIALFATLTASTTAAADDSKFIDICEEAYGMTCPELHLELIKYESLELPEVVAEYAVDPADFEPPTCLSCPPHEFFENIKEARIIEMKDLSLLVLNLEDAAKVEQIQVYDADNKYAELGGAVIFGDVQAVMGLGSSSRELYLVADKLVDHGVFAEPVPMPAKEWVTGQ